MIPVGVHEADIKAYRCTMMQVPTRDVRSPLWRGSPSNSLHSVSDTVTAWVADHCEERNTDETV